MRFFFEGSPVETVGMAAGGFMVTDVSELGERIVVVLAISAMNGWWDRGDGWVGQRVEIPGRMFRRVVQVVGWQNRAWI